MSIADHVKSARIGVLPPRPNLQDLGKVSVNASVSLERTVLDEVLRYYVEVGTNIRVPPADKRPENWYRDLAARQIHGHLYVQIENTLHRIYDKSRAGADVSQDIAELIETVVATQ